MSFSERRAEYRVGGLGETFAVEVRFEANVIGGVAVDLTNRGVGVSFPYEGTARPDLPPVGEIVELSISSGHWPEPVKVTAQTVQRSDVRPNLTVCGFEFEVGSDFASSHGGSMFNRRAALRVSPAEDSDVEAVLETGSSPVVGRVHDVSITGLGIIVDRSVERTMPSGVVGIRVRLTVPTSAEAFVLAVDVRSRRLFEESGVLYGMSVDESKSEPAAVNQLREYVMECQREALRERLEPGPD